MGIGGKTVLLNRDILKDNNLAYIPGEFGQLCVARTEVPVVLNVFCEVAEFPLRPEQSRANLQTPVYSRFTCKTLYMMVGQAGGRK
jgi:hypothetical protein